MQRSHHTRHRAQAHPRGEAAATREIQRKNKEKKEKSSAKETSPQQTYIPRYDQLRSAASSPTDLRWGNFGNCGKECRDVCTKQRQENISHQPHALNLTHFHTPFAIWGRRGSPGKPQSCPTFTLPWARLGFL